MEGILFVLYEFVYEMIEIEGYWILRKKENLCNILELKLVEFMILICLVLVVWDENLKLFKFRVESLYFVFRYGFFYLI